MDPVCAPQKVLKCRFCCVTSARFCSQGRIQTNPQRAERDQSFPPQLLPISSTMLALSARHVKEPRSPGRPAADSCRHRRVSIKTPDQTLNLCFHPTNTLITQQITAFMFPRVIKTVFILTSRLFIFHLTFIKTFFLLILPVLKRIGTNRET